MKKLKILPGILILTVYVAGITGCSLFGKKPDSAKQNTPEISFGYWDLDSLQDSSNSDAITALLEDKFGFRASFQSFDWSTYKEQYQVLAATGDLPDVFTNVLLSSNDANDSALYRQMVNEGFLQPLPEDLSDYPNLQDFLSDYEYLRDEDGHFYAIPHPLFAEDILSSSDAAMLVRKDWMETLDIQPPENIDEFISMTAAFAKEDPDGNGIDDTIGYNVNNLAALGKWVMLGISPECNVFSWIEDTDGSYCPCWMTDSFRDVITAYRKLYQSGGLDPDFYTKNSSTVLNDFTSGKLGALEYKSSASSLAELEDMWNSKNSLPFDSCVAVLPVMKAPDGVRYCNSSSSFWSETYISSSVTDQELDVILTLMDYLLSDEGAELYTRGISGTDYVISADNELVSKIAKEGSAHFVQLLKKYPSVELWSNLVSRGWDASDFEDTQETRFLYNQECVALSQDALTFCENNTVQIDRPYDFHLYPKEHSSFSNTAFDAFIKCIIETEDPLTMWDRALTSMEAQGLSEYVARQNQSYQESLKSKSK